MRRSIVLVAVALSLAPVAFAHEEEFTSTLDGAQAGVVTGATATAEMHYDTDTNTIEELHIFCDGIFTADLLSSTIRIGAPGVSGPLAFTIQNIWWGDGTEGMLLDVHVVGPISEADEAQMLAGNAYLNIATHDFELGEIRGQLIFVPAPGPVTLALLGVGVLASRRRR